MCGISIGRGTVIIGSMELVGEGPIWKRLSIGENCVLNGHLYLDLNDTTTIGNNVSIGNHCIVVTSGHSIGPAEARCAELKPSPVRIEDGCWIGARATLMPGVTVGAGSIVSAGAVVFADVPTNKVVGGNPARQIRTLE